MKILHIRFSNLNSLAGSWSIDLTGPEYSADGIFAITGPTGAGKTTLLDAVCLALYGRTPRLKQISKTANEIMTRNTGDCWSEVEFATAKGIFRCHWSQHRARRSASGDLQQPRHEIIEAESGRPLETKIKQVAQKVVEVTGMTYEQFTRSILLAQGDFNIFLQASPDERAPILEQITGTEVYSRISRKVHEKRNQEQDQLELLRRQCDGFTPLPLEELAALNLRIDSLALRAASQQEQIERSRQVLDHHRRLEQLAKALDQQQRKLAELDEKWQGLAAKRDQLERADRARTVNPTYQQLQELQGLQQEERLELTAVEKRLDKLTGQLQKGEEMLKTSNGRFKQLKEQAHVQEGVLREVRRRDQQLHALTDQRTALDQELTRLNQQLQDTATARENAQKRLHHLQHQLEKLSSLQQTHSVDQELVEQYGGIIIQFNQYSQLASRQQAVAADLPRLEARQSELASRMADSATAIANLGERLASCKTQEQEQAAQRKTLIGDTTLDQLYQQDNRCQQELLQLDQAKDQHRRLQELEDELAGQHQQLAESEKERQQLTQSDRELALQLKAQQAIVDQQQQIVLLAGKIRSYEEERQLLRDGTACPLCGSTSHPFCTGDAAVDHNSEQKRLGHESELLAQLQDKLLFIRSELAGKVREAEMLTKTYAATSKQRDQSTASLSELAHSLGLESSEDLTEQIARRQQETAAARSELVRLFAAIGELQKAELQTATSKARLSEDLASAERLGHQLAAEQLKLEQDRERRIAERGELEQATHEASRQLQTAIAPYTKTAVTTGNSAAILKKLAERKTFWQTRETEKNRLTVTVKEGEAECSSHILLQQRQQATREEKLSQLQTLDHSVAALRQERHEMLGEEDPDRVEQHLRQQLEKEEEQIHSQSEAINTLQQDRAAMAAELAGLKQRIKVRASQLEQRTSQFHQSLLAAEFIDVDDFLNHRLDEEAHKKLAGEIDSLRQAILETRTLLDSSAAALAEESTRFPGPPPAADETARELAALQQQYAELQQEMGALRQQRQHDEQQRQLHAARLAELESQRQTLVKWSRLHELIGSSDGKKFRNFAQGLTFEIMISHANLSLARMSDRYLLVRDPHEPLELHVIDNYQGGEIRSTKNLSGGESFIVSMALALGLSSMASHNVQVDSLFLDEGFGTLDEDSLQTALDTLSGLNQQGKIIGVISHVAGLRERITTQIRVTPGVGGISRLSGPGVASGRSQSAGDAAINN